jgi:hypothetical protein
VKEFVQRNRVWFSFGVFFLIIALILVPTLVSISGRTVAPWFAALGLVTFLLACGYAAVTGFKEARADGEGFTRSLVTGAKSIVSFWSSLGA